MMKKILFLFCIMIVQNNFSQTINENEKQLSVILDSLNNNYYHQSIPEDFMGRTPPQGYWKKYPFRVKLYKFFDEVETILKKPLSPDYLLTLYDKKFQRNMSQYYITITDKILKVNSNDSNLKLWNFATIELTDNGKFTNWQFTNYVVREFVRLEILKEHTKNYILKNLDFNVNYCGHFGKEIDLKIIDAQIAILETNMKMQYLGDAPRWAGYLFLENAVKLKKNCTINLADWYRYKYYYLKVEQGIKVNYSDYDWDNYIDKKNVELTIRFLNALKENYVEIYQKCENELKN